jgi:predicted HD superfamily hydrolase involved in NAD metabolism
LESWDRTAILKYLSRHVSKARLTHCLGVEEVALKLAPRFEVFPEMVSPAALLHDLCREFNPELLLKLAVNFGIVIDDIEKAEPLLLHGPVAAAKIREELGITQPEILEAIHYHITGAANIKALTQLIFIADFIEPGRIYQPAKLLRDQAFSLKPEQLLLKVYNHAMIFVINQGYLVHPRTMEGRNQLIMKGIRH